MNGTWQGMFVAAALVAMGCGDGGGGTTTTDAGPTGGTGGTGGEIVGGSGGVGGEIVGGSGGEVGGTVGGAGGVGGEIVGGSGGVGGEIVGGSGGVGGGGGGGGAGGELPPPPDGCGAVSLNDGAQADGTYLVQGSTAAASDTAVGSCSGEGAPDVVYGFVAPEAGTWIFTTQVEDPATSYDTSLYARTDCADAASELPGACNDDISPDADIFQSAIAVSLERGQGIYVHVDGYDDTSSGDFVLRAYPASVVPVGGECVPGAVDAVCDAELICADVDGDGTFLCEQHTLIPPGGACEAGSPVAECEPGYACVGGTCVDPFAAACASAVSLNDSALEDGSFQIAGTTVDSLPYLNGSCGGTDAPELVYSFTAPTAGQWVFSTEQGEGAETYDTLIYARAECANPDSELEGACNDDSDLGGVQSRMTVTLEAGQAITVVVDGYRVGGPFVLTAFPLNVLNPGDACVVGDVRNVCPEGNICSDPDRDGNGTCAEPIAPTLASVEVFYNATTYTMAFRATGTDGDADLVGLGFTLYDEAGEEIPLSFFGGPVYVEFDDIVYNGFDVTGTLVIGIELPEAVRGTFFLFDGANGESAPVDADILATPVGAAGDACDFNGAFLACPADLVCDGEGVAPAAGVCAAPVTECADTVGATELVADENGVVEVTGSLENLVDHITGSCSAEAAGDVGYIFTPGEDGTYVMTFGSDDADAAYNVVVRELCNVEDLGHQVACGQVAGESLPASLSVELQAGVPVFVFIESVGGEAPYAGTYTLSIHAAHAPVISSAAVYYNAETGGLGIEINGTDVDGDIAGFGIMLTDPNGELVIATEEGGLVDVGVEAEEIIQNPDGTTTLHLTRYVQDLTADLVGEFTVDLVDASGLRSETLVAELLTPAELGAGDPCTYSDGFEACPAGTMCSETEEGMGGTCDPV